MAADVLFPIIGGVIMMIIAWMCLQEDSGFGLILCLCLGGFWFWCAYDNNKPETIAAKAAEERAKVEERRRQETPHVVREADGCKVYAFKSGDRWHYFTRCPNAVTVTDTAYEHCTGSGKTRSCKELHDSIEVR